MKKRRYLTLLAAALLAVAPVATTATTLATHADVVKAEKYRSTPDPNATEIDFTAPTLRFEKYAMGGLQTIANWQRGVKVNHGKIMQNGDVLDFQDEEFYKNDRNGNPIMSWPLDWNNFTKEDKGTALIFVTIEGLHPHKKYTYLAQAPWHGKKGSGNYENGKLFWKTAEADDNGEIGDTDPGTPSGDESSSPIIKTQFAVGSKRKAVKRNYRVGTIDASSSRVRTYNSHGRFNHHYVYDQSNYKFNQRKVIKGKVYYKLYGRNNYVRANVIDF